MIRNDKDGCLQAITQESKLQFYKIRRTLHNIIRARKRSEVISDAFDNQKMQLAKLDRDIDNTKENKYIEFSLDSPEKKRVRKASDGLNNTKDNMDMAELNDVNKDSAIFRFKKGGLKIVGDAELAAQLSQSANVNFWKTVASIHTLVKAKVGLGKSIF